MERILIEGVVEHGRRLGRELGFPTANLAVPEDVAAADGVYRSRAEVGGKVYDAMSNLGRNPSVGGVERRLETHIFDFRGELYGRWLRVELLDDEQQIAKFNKDLDELELMVKGALQTVKDTDIHENIEQLDIDAMLEQMAEAMNLHEDLLTIEGHCKWPYRGKLLALKRCIGNLVDNGIKYGQKVRIIIMDDEEMLILFIMDEGPGLPDDQFERIFEPYYRLSTDAAGTGLGLGIARNIAHAHGGDLVLENRPQGGLQATLSLPRQ
mgnify:CR=1 FL=1